jgi:hypothetical protein
MLQRANWKVIGVLVAMSAAGILMTSWPSWAQQNVDAVPAYGQPGAKKEQADTQPDLKRAADELVKLKQYLDMLKADYDRKAAQLQEAQKKPATIEQRLSEIEHKLDMIIAALGKRGPMAIMPGMAPPTLYYNPVAPAVKPFTPAQPYAPTQPRQPTPEGNGFAPVFPATEPGKQ